MISNMSQGGYTNDDHADGHGRQHEQAESGEVRQGRDRTPAQTQTQTYKNSDLHSQVAMAIRNVRSDRQTDGQTTRQ